MSKTLSREVIEELQRYKAGPVAPRLKRSDAVDSPKIGHRYNSAEISRLVAALIMSTQQSLSEEARKQSSTRSIAA
jgi:uncharacterized pyridoxal phosphate-containing UPF0001 family protein